MALVTVQRSPTPSATSSPCASEADSGEDDSRFQPRSISESFLTVKGAALFLPRGNGSSAPRISHRRNKHAGDLQQHLQAMFLLLRPEDNIRLAVRLESTYQNRTRYMVIVSTNGRQDTEESIVLGMDFSSNDSSICTMGLVLPLWSDALIHLDGDGGFSVSTDNRIHIFKPVSVQAMWSALQSLHKACEVARLNNYYPGSLFLTWVSYYESHINSDQTSVNEWNAMQDVQSHRPDSPTLFTDVPTERERTERLIKTKLREIMMQKDLENITSKEIRTELEMQMAYNLREFKEFIDNEMIVILGQMDSPTEIFEHVFLGSEWNASNLEELQNRGVRYILNVTREIDNFFPGIFEYHNIRVYDEEATDLLAYWNDTYKFISKAKKNGSKCLVHCKMGVSRSASTVIAYAMKEYGWNLDRAYDYVKERRTVTKPNPSFMRQLEEYQGILLASKQRHNKLWRSHSDSDLSDHHEPMGKSGMEVSKKEITTSADQISDNKASNCHPLSMAPGLPTGALTEHQGPSMNHICHKERVIQLEITPRDYPAEPMEENLNLNHLNGCPPLCCLGETTFPPDNCDALSGALRQQRGMALEVVAASFPDLAVDDVEKDALKHGDGNVHLVPMEELESCLRDTSGQNSPSPPPPAVAPAARPEEEEEVEFGTDRIDFFSALEKFVELSQDSRPRACSHSRAEEVGGNGGRNNLPKGAVLELSPSDPAAEDVAPNSNARSSPQASEESSAEEEQPLKLSEPDRLSGLMPSVSENAISVKEIVTEIESIHQGAGQGPLKMDAMNNPTPAPKRNPVYEPPAELAWTWESKIGKAEPNEGGSSLPKETSREPLKLDPEAAGVLSPDPSDVEETGDLAEDMAEGRGNLRPKWCPGSVRRATLEFEERLRQEQEIQHVSPLAALPFRKNSKNESSSTDLSTKGKHGDPPHEPAQTSRDKETSKSGNARTDNGPEPPAENPSSSPPCNGPSSEVTGLAREHRIVVSVDSPEKTSTPCRLLLLPPKRIEIIEYTPMVHSPAHSDANRSGPPAVAAETVAVDENCNTTLGSETPAEPLERIDFRKVVFSVGSPDKDDGDIVRASTDSSAAFIPANRSKILLPPRFASRPFLCVEGVTQGSTSSDPEPAQLGGYAGHGQFALEERGRFPRRRSESALTHWNQEDFDVPDTLGGEVGKRPPSLAAPSPLRRSLLHSSSSDSLLDRSGFNARIRQAGLTTSSPMKRSASLAKLDHLGLSKEDLHGRGRTLLCGHLVSPCAPFACGDPAPQGPAAPPVSPPPPESPRPTWHLVEQVKLTEYVALSKPVERPTVQYAQEFGPTREPPETKLTSAQADGLPESVAPCTPQRIALPPRYQHGRTRPPRRPKKANDRKRTANPLYNSM